MWAALRRAVLNCIRKLAELERTAVGKLGCLSQRIIPGDVRWKLAMENLPSSQAKPISPAIRGLGGLSEHLEQAGNSESRSCPGDQCSRQRKQQM